MTLQLQQTLEARFVELEASQQVQGRQLEQVATILCTCPWSRCALEADTNRSPRCSRAGNATCRLFAFSVAKVQQQQTQQQVALQRQIEEKLEQLQVSNSMTCVSHLLVQKYEGSHRPFNVNLSGAIAGKFD